MSEFYFLKMVRQLRENEELLLYSKRGSITEEEKKKVTDFLRFEYSREATGFPFEPPKFNAAAALCSAEFVYLVAQLILCREEQTKELENILPKMEFEVNNESMLSIDLCFRFLPDLLIELKHIDSEDALILILEEKLHIWHYSGVKYDLETAKLQFDWVFASECMEKLYLDRIVECKNLRLAKKKEIHQKLKGDLSIYEEAYWNDFKTLVVDE